MFSVKDLLEDLHIDANYWDPKVVMHYCPPNIREVYIDYKSPLTPPFHQKNIEAPQKWSDQAVSIATTKYFRGNIGSPDRETSVYDMVERVVSTIVGWCYKKTCAEDTILENMKLRISVLLLEQVFCYNSPVWFNLGVQGRKQAVHACYINHVDDSMESILNLVKTEGMMFKDGSGSGVNISNIRGRGERMSSGGYASGPMSFARGWDAMAGAIKSGGATRRSAKMLIMDDDHPDIIEFVQSKHKAEEVIRNLSSKGYRQSLDDDPWTANVIAPYQNANNSVRISNKFMEQIMDYMNPDYNLRADEGYLSRWELKPRKEKEKKDLVSAKEIWNEICEAALDCGDPGIQFRDTINSWNTCPKSGEIRASNPCSEFLWLDNTACNLASLNLEKFLVNGNDPANFDFQLFNYCIDILVETMDSFYDHCEFPNKEVEEESKKYRCIGIGYSNLGGLLMRMGIAYDSDEGRAIAATITSAMTAMAYAKSSELASKKGTFPAYDHDSMIKIMEKHYKANESLYSKSIDVGFHEKDISHISNMWTDLYNYGKGFRNAQVTLLAPCGTISFLMDCATTGIEPEVGLVKYKSLAGGGIIKQINPLIKYVIDRFIPDYPTKAKEVEESILAGKPIEQLEIPEKMKKVLQTSYGSNPISPMGHVNMVAAVQPFLSGGISKTVSLPSNSTKEDVGKILVESWKKGIKCISVYRDGSKEAQPVKVVTSSDKTIENIDKKEEKENKTTGTTACHPRKKPPKERLAKTRKIQVGNMEIYVTIGFYDDGKPCEVFLRAMNPGGLVSGILDCLAIALSICLQYGIAEDVMSKLRYRKFEPSGFTGDPDIPMVESLVDAVVRLIDKVTPPSRNNKDTMEQIATEQLVNGEIPVIDYEKRCPKCEAAMVRTGTCHTCPRCGTNGGCG